MVSWNRFRRSIDRFHASSSEQRRLALEAWWELLLVAAWLRTPFRRRLLGPALRRPVVDRRPAVATRLSRAIRSASSNHLKPMTCLERSLALGRLLERRRVPVRLRIGVRRVGPALEAHAWLEGPAAPADPLRKAFATVHACPPAAIWSVAG